MATLGTGRNEAWIYMRGGKVPVAPVENASSIQWNRTLNSASTAELRVTLGAHGDCCGLWSRVGTWGHELVVFRDGDRVWEGPITNIQWSSGGVQVLAHDVLGYLKRRPTRNVLDTTPKSIETAAWEDIVNSFSTTVADDPNVVPNVVRVTPGGGPAQMRDVLAFSQYVYDQLVHLSTQGLMFTTIGRSIVLWVSGHALSRTGVLVPAQHISGEVVVEEDGMGLATATWMINDEGLVGGSNPYVDPFYGYVARLEDSEAIDSAGLVAAANQVQGQSHPAPVRVIMPEDAVMSCDAPFTIEELVAGATVPVQIRGGLCRPVDSLQILNKVTVSTESGGENVTVSLSDYEER